LSVVLLVGMGAFVESLRNVTSLPLNLDIDRLIVAEANLQGAGFDAAAAASAYRALAARAVSVPGVASVALVEGLPFHSSVETRFRLPGHDSIAALAHRDVRMIAVTADYFATTGTPLFSGREFLPGTGAQRVAIVNDVLARLVWPGESPLGKCVIVGFGDQPCAEVIGVAAATRGFDGEADPQVYVPLDNGARLLPARVLVIRLANGASGIGARLQQTLQRAIPNLPYVDAAPMRSLIAPTVAPSRLGASLLGVFGGLALLLSAIGLYGTTSYVVRQRMSEMGVRLALGASPASLLRLVVRRALIVTAIGLVVGVIIAVATQGEVAPLLFRTTMHEPGMLVGVSVVVTVVALLAAMGPAVRAARADPLASLRSE
jgi:predicted permease